jgi:zinc transport system substrate-binding protein
VRTRIILISVLAIALGGVVLLAVAGGEQGNGRGSGAGPDVVAGVYPLAYAAQQLGSPDLQVENLTPPGAEPHDIEVSAGDVQELQSAGLVLLMGRDFQPQLEEAAERARGRVVEILEGAPAGTVRDDDPHIWLDPLRFGYAAKRIAAALGTPEARAALAGFERRLAKLHSEYRSGLARCQRHEIVTGHDAFGYLAERYGLTEIPILGLSPEAEPSPGALDDAVARVRETGATTVFTESLLPADLAETVARETGAGTAVLNPIEGLTEQQQQTGEDYFSLMRENLVALREGLGCR